MLMPLCSVLMSALANFYNAANDSVFTIAYNISLAIGITIVALSNHAASNCEFILVRCNIYFKDLCNEVASNDDKSPTVETEGESSTYLAVLPSTKILTQFCQ